MIASLAGIIEAVSKDSLIVNVNGIGFKVTVTTSVLSEMGITGREVKLYTHFHVREDDMSLFGFSSLDELKLFETLISVSGLGPKTGMAMLSAMSADQVAMAIASGSVEILTTIPGIGKKTADRLILELKDKVGGVMISSSRRQSRAGKCRRGVRAGLAGVLRPGNDQSRQCLAFR